MSFGYVSHGRFSFSISSFNANKKKKKANQKETHAILR